MTEKQSSPVIEPHQIYGVHARKMPVLVLLMISVLTGFLALILSVLHIYSNVISIEFVALYVALFGAITLGVFLIPLNKTPISFNSIKNIIWNISSILRILVIFYFWIGLGGILLSILELLEVTSVLVNSISGVVFGSLLGIYAIQLVVLNYVVWVNNNQLIAEEIYKENQESDDT